MSALERAATTARPQSLLWLLGSLERLKAIAWERLITATAVGQGAERQATEPLDQLRHLTPVQVADLLSLKEAYIHELCRSRQIPATKQGKYWIIPVAELREWLGRSRRGIDPGRSSSVPWPHRPGVPTPSSRSGDLPSGTPGRAPGRRRGTAPRRLQHQAPPTDVKASRTEDPHS